MPLLQVVMVLIVVGVLLWLINRYIPMQGTIKSILNAVVVIVVALWLLKVFGLFSSLPHIRAPYVAPRMAQRVFRNNFADFGIARSTSRRPGLELRDDRLISASRP